ncbi:hypothetical protein GH714_040282 [Hevea brasiliensis]|uniref:Protein kinase domain-containing protein n=1 Tax=Hevea brasiliensis TaxID=3981 RepID=A0A6A6MTV0_HEVBR|nr:hypothetical protein GH714_040282 [Hevea brasiliensis]
MSKETRVRANTELRALMDMKAALDPEDKYLSSWTNNGDPCDGSFEGIACNDYGQVANISLQGKGLRGKLSPAIAGLMHLTGLYLHYNSLYGKMPKEIANLKGLSDLYLNVNNLSGEIPPEIGDMENLQVLQLCYNQFTGSIPTQLGSLKKLNVLALQSNQLTGAIPASLGDMGVLMRLDLSFNSFFGSIPTKLADAPLLEVLDVRNNSLSGNVPLDHINPSTPEPFGPDSTGLPTREIPETANLQLPCNQTHCSNSSRTHQAAVVVGTIILTIALSVIGILTFTQYRRQKQKLGSSFEISDSRPSTDQAKGVYRKNGSPLISLEYSNGWDPLADGRNFSGHEEDVFRSFMFNLDEVETAAQYFSEVNLLGKSNFSATYKGILRDGSVVAIRALYLDVKDGDGCVLEWSTRVSIVKGIAKGIAYLHGYKVNKPALIHQNITAQKVLLDQRRYPLLADSGLQNLLTNDIVFSALKASAAMGYLAPEYAATGRFTDKSDVYAFGVIVFQVLSGKREVTNLVRLAAESCTFQDYIDPNLHGRFDEYEAAKLARIAWLCAHESPIERPSMEAIVQELGNCSSCL